jgi:aspartyl aminopeptidase
VSEINYKELQEKLSHNFTNVWTKLTEEQLAEVEVISKEYKYFLDNGKTERTSANEIIRMAVENGYQPLEAVLASGKLEVGTKVYAVNKGKSVALFYIGEKNMAEGVHIVGSHIDSPRLDIKPFPLYEEGEMAFLKTHYYGGIKKYQWTTIPLALHGVVIDKDGNKIDVCIGEDDNDPIFVITDLLPHLAKDQSTKTLADGITGEGLNVLAGSIPYGDKDTKDKVKFNVMRLLNEKYGFGEKEFTVAELEIVPAGKARDVGLDRGMISAYGHDDRVCAYASLRAIFDMKSTPSKTAIAYFSDKEEVGSMGNTGAESAFLENTIAELINVQMGSYNDLMLRRAFSQTEVLSADVGAGFDPNYGDCYDKKNSALMGYGIQLVKYTGSRGKGGCNDANSEFVAKIKNLFEANDVMWQVGELGKVDQGGGGTIAYILANKGAEVIDCGVPVLSMHAPYEVISKADLYMTIKGYFAFMNR